MPYIHVRVTDLQQTLFLSWIARKTSGKLSWYSLNIFTDRSNYCNFLVLLKRTISSAYLSYWISTSCECIIIVTVLIIFFFLHLIKFSTWMLNWYGQRVWLCLTLICTSNLFEISPATLNSYHISVTGREFFKQFFAFEVVVGCGSSRKVMRNFFFKKYMPNPPTPSTAPAINFFYNFSLFLLPVNWSMVAISFFTPIPHSVFSRRITFIVHKFHHKSTRLLL